MASIWRSLFGKTEERLSQDDWAGYFNYKNYEYPLAITATTPYTNKEYAERFDSVAARIYKTNGVVFACLVARMRAFSEARFQFQAVQNGTVGDLFGKTDLEVLEHPWPNGTTGDLLARAIQDVDLFGNFYCVREGNRLRRLRPDWVDIVLTEAPALAVKSDVAAYVYKPGGVEDGERWEIYPVDGTNGQICHWAPTPDPEAQYRGMSPLTPALEEIEGDNLGRDHKNGFLRNSATPHIAVSFKETVTEEQFREFMKAVEANHVGARQAYKTLYLGGGADVKPLTVDFRQLDFKKVQGGGETRIAAALRIHPVLVGLSEGMQGASLNAGNFKTAKDSFVDLEIRPMWRTLCAALESVVNVPPSSRLWIDDRDIAFVREDIKDIAEIASLQATIVTKLIQDGFTPDSIQKALPQVQGYDWSVLKHTGLFSVQLQPPMPDGPQEGTPGITGQLAKAPHSRPGRPSNAQLGKTPAADSSKNVPATPKAAPKPAPPATKK